MRRSIKSRLLTVITAAAIALQSLAVPAAATGLLLAPQKSEAGIIKKGLVGGALFAGYSALVRHEIFTSIRSAVVAGGREDFELATQKFIKFIEFSKARTEIADWMISFIRTNKLAPADRIEALSNELGASKFGSQITRLTDEQAASKGLSQESMAQMEQKAEALESQASNTVESEEVAQASSEAEAAVSDKEWGFDPKFWNQPKDVNGVRVYQRDDLFDPSALSQRTKNGESIYETNVERMRQGLAPKGYDGESVNLHHLTQDQPGALAEVGGKLHSKNSGILHGIEPNGKSFRGDELLNNEFNAYRAKYWKTRSLDFQ